MNGCVEQADRAPVAIITVTLNSAGTVARCLQPLRARGPSFYVIVVDNGSHDDTARTVRRRQLADAVIGNDRNHGYGAAVNQALSHLARLGVDTRAVVLLDPDCFITPHELLTLAADLDDVSHLGAISPALVGPDGATQVTAHGFRNLRTETRRVLREAPPDALAHQLAATVYLTDWVVGACLVLRPAAITDIDRIAERYFVYVEDIDTCYRLRAAGWEVAIDTSVRARHIGGHSLSHHPLRCFAPVLKLVNELDFYESVHNPARRAGVALLRVLRALRKGEFLHEKTLVLLLACLGLRAGRIGRIMLRRHNRRDPAAGEVIPAAWLTPRRPRRPASATARARRGAW